MAEAAILLLTGALVAPHLLPLERVSPVAAGAVWLGALALRALIVLALALTALLVLPSTGLFRHVAEWSHHLFAGPPHVDLSGEPLAHLAALAPPALLAMSLIAFAVTIARGALSLRREVARRALGDGPLGSVVIADAALLVAVPGVGRGRILLSDRALAELDPAELEGCLAHEAGHLRRGHRWLGLIAGCLATVARPVPGARAAEQGLRLSLERDADEFATARTGDPLALASAICKIARHGRRTAMPALGLAGTGPTKARLDGLLGGGERRAGTALERAAIALAWLLMLCVAAGAAGLALWLVYVAPTAGVAAALACA